MMISEQIRTKYKELKALADAAYAAAEPQRKALHEAEKPWSELQEQIEELIAGHEVRICENCTGPIFEGDPSHQTGDGQMCEKCAPTYQDMLSHPEMFWNADEEEMTPDHAKAICDRHIAAGGKLSDSLAR